MDFKGEKLAATDSRKRELEERLRRLVDATPRDRAGRLTRVLHEWRDAADAQQKAQILSRIATTPWPETDRSRFDPFHVRGVRDVVDKLLTIPAGQALWPSVAVGGTPLSHAAERRAATLCRRASDSGEIANDDPIVDEALARIGSGEPLPRSLRERMEAELGVSLAHVRIHTDGVAAAAARSVRAAAFTVGEDIFFAAGAFAPDSRDGQKLIAHELAHVVQAQQGRISIGSGRVVSMPGDAIEHEADAVAARTDRAPTPAAETKGSAPGVSLANNVFGGGGPEGSHAAHGSHAAAPAAPGSSATQTARPADRDFEVTHWSAARNTRLDWGPPHDHRSYTHLTIQSGGIHASAHVRARTPEAQRYSVGFVQTLHHSRREAVYQAADGSVANRWIALRGRAMDQRTDIHSPAPWYNFGVNLGATARRPEMSDNPNVTVPDESPNGGRLAEMQGDEVFTTWLVAMVGNDPLTIVYLANVHWHVNWSGRFDPGYQTFSGHDSRIGAAQLGGTGDAEVTGPPANEGPDGDFVGGPPPQAQPAAQPQATAAHGAPPTFAGPTRDFASEYGGGSDTVGGASGVTENQYFDRWFHGYPDGIYNAANDRMQRLPFRNPPYTYWLWGRNDAFISSTMFSMYDAAEFRRICDPEMHTAINRGRTAADTGVGTNEWRPEVGREVSALLQPKIAESLARLAPAWIAACYQRWRSLDADTRSRQGIEITLPADALVGSSPIDRHVIAGLRANQLHINFDIYAREVGDAGAAAAVEPSRRPITNWSFDIHDGAVTWIRVQQPANATATEVAFLLYGDSTHANEIIAAAPRYGFRPNLLAPTIANQWRDALRAATVGDVNAHRDSQEATALAQAVAAGHAPEIDPAAEIIRVGGQQADQAALAQAGRLHATGANRNEVIVRLTLCQSLLDSIGDSIRQMTGYTSIVQVAPLRQRLDQRLAHLRTTADAAEVSRWDAQSGAQLDILRQSATGIRNASQQYTQLTGGGRQQAGAQAADLAAHIRIPIFRLAHAYEAAVAVSELADVGGTRLSAARRQEDLFPIELIEGILQVCRVEIQRCASATGSVYDQEAPDMAQEEARLRELMFQAREQITTNPAEARRLISGAMATVSTLQEKATMLGTLTTFWEEWTTLNSADSSIFDAFTSRQERYRTQQAKLDHWQQRFWATYLLYKYARDDQALRAARQQWEELRSHGEEIQRDIVQTAEIFASEERRLRWIRFGARVAVMIGIAVVTMGVGAYVEGALLVGAGWGLSTAGTLGAAVVATGAEAATFTLATNTIFETDHSVKALLRSFAENWVLFGAMRGMSFVVEGAIGAAFGAEAAMGAAGQVANITTGLTANIAYSMMRADQQARQHGQPNGLNEDQKRDIVIENVAVFIGTMIAARYGRGFLENIRRSGSESWVARLATVDQARADALRLARETTARPSLDTARAALEQDTATLRQEVDTLREMERWATDNPTAAARLGLTAERLATVRALDEGALNARERASVGLELESAGGDVFRVDTARFEDVTGRLRRLGDTVEVTVNEATHLREARVRSRDGGTMRIHERAGRDRVQAVPEPITQPTRAPTGPESHTDVQRWNHEGLQGDPRGQALLADPVFRQWYDAWMNMPDRVVVDANGVAHANYPRDVPTEVRAQLQRVFEQSNLTLMTRAVITGEQLRAELDRLGFHEPNAIDPRSEAWNRARQRLGQRFGEANIQRYEQSVLQRPGDPARAALDARVHDILRDGALAQLRTAFPEAQIYLTGSMTQASTAGTRVVDVDVIIVAPEGTSLDVRIAMEERAAGMRLPTSEAYRDAIRARGEPVPETLPVDAKVMTPQEYAGFTLSPNRGRTPLRQLRIDSQTPDAAAPGVTGVDLHNHIMGVTGTDYFVQRVGAGSAETTVNNIWQLIQTPPPGEAIPATVAAEITAARAAIAQMRSATPPAPPEMIEARAREALDRSLAASHTVPFDATYTLRDILISQFVDPGGGAFRNYARDVVEALAREGVHYSEQSVSMSKLRNRFSAQTMDAIRAELRARGLDSDLRFLAMFNTTTTLSAGEIPAGQPDPFQAQLAQFRDLVQRGDVMGVDVAGPEANAFTARGMANFREIYRVLQEAGRARHRPLVLRPHVGEGYAEPGSHDAAHGEIAERNLEMLITTLRAAGHTGNPAHDGVIIRFGHATHATPAQIRAMRDLGVIVEANIGSNLATGAIVSPNEHPLLYNLFYGTRTILNTDAQGVMDTTLPAEYESAARIIDRFRANRVALEINGRPLYFRDIRDPNVQNRFSVDQLHRWAAEYRDQVGAADQSDTARTRSGPPP